MTFDAGTFIDLEESLAAEFESLFAERTFMNSIGHSVRLKSYVHSLPVKQGDDDVLLDEHLPEPTSSRKFKVAKKPRMMTDIPSPSMLSSAYAMTTRLGTATKISSLSFNGLWRGSGRTQSSADASL